MSGFFITVTVGNAVTHFFIMLYNIKQNAKKLKQGEMKLVKGGLADAAPACRTGSCSYYEAHTGTVTGTCQTNSAGRCVCNATSSSVVLSECNAPAKGGIFEGDAFLFDL